jgi:hypothetical protein
METYELLKPKTVYLSFKVLTIMNVWALVETRRMVWVTAPYVINALGPIILG